MSDINVFDSAKVTNALLEAFEGMLPVISKEWINWPLDNVKELRAIVSTIDEMSLSIRSGFDSELWQQHDAGRFNEIESVRKRRAPDSDKPGRKAAIPTMAERFAKFGKR